MTTKSGNYRSCRRGESPKPRKSGYSSSDRKQMKSGEVRFNKSKGIWEKREQ